MIATGKKNNAFFNALRYWILVGFIFTLFQDNSFATTFTVTKTGGNTGATSNDGSFSGAIIAANAAAAAGVHRIVFAIPSGGAPWTIDCTGMTNTTTISKNVIIDGSTQGGWTCGNPVIVLSGSGALR